MPTPIDSHDLVYADWQASGLDLDDATQLRVGLLTHAEREALDVFTNPALLFPYFKPDGKVIEGFGRIRLYHDDPDQPKYIQFGAGTEAYLPPTVEWSKIFSDTEQRIFITEGEKKAACATKLGFPCVGIGGVDNFKNKANPHSGVLPVFDEIEWARRSVYIVYDSDIHENLAVQGAAFRLQRELIKRGAKVFLVLMPPSQAKVGLDDYLVTEGPIAFEELLQRSERVVTLSSMLEDLRDRIVVLRTGSVYDLRDSKIYSREHFEKTAFPHWNIEAPPGPRGGRPERIYAAHEYLEWKHRVDVTEVDTRADLPRGVHKIDDRNVLNWFQGYACDPKRGSVAPFTRLVKRLTQGDRAMADYLIGWLAHPLQNPGDRTDVAVVLVSVTNGTGKSTLGRTMLRIYGDNGQHGQYLRPGMLFASFNGWAKACLFAYADEIPDEGRISHRREAFKALIDQPYVNVNIKHIPEVDAVHRCNYLFTTNNPGAIPMDESDRRFFVLNVKEEYWSNDEADDYYRWLDDGGAEALFDYLLRYKSKTFIPHRKPPVTDAKIRMIEASRPKVSTLVDEYLKDGPPELFTDDDVWRSVSGKVGRTSEYTRTTIGAVVDRFDRVHTRVVQGLRVHSLGRGWKALTLREATRKWADFQGNESP